tara:strand:+ start:101 stop:529 length:429 start_codon:yes stop_codon:yes gene_type:complete
MSQVFTNKIKSAKFVNPPENSVIELLYNIDESTLCPFHIAVNFSDPAFLDFIKEWPLEKLEKQARAKAKAEAQVFFEEKAKGYQKFEILSFIDKNNKDKDIVFECKLKILDTFIAKPKNKALQLKIRKCKTLKELLGLYYGI